MSDKLNGHLEEIVTATRNAMHTSAGDISIKTSVEVYDRLQSILNMVVETRARIGR